jgi:hypothetical protein
VLAALFGSCDLAQGPQKNLTIDAMLGTGIVNRVEAGDWATNATHFEIEKSADRRRVVPHHLVHQIIEFDWHRKSLVTCKSIEPIPPDLFVGAQASEHFPGDEKSRGPFRRLRLFDATADFGSGNVFGYLSLQPWCAAVLGVRTSRSD